MSLYSMNGVHGDGALPQTTQRDTSHGYSFASPLPAPTMMGLIHPLGELLARGDDASTGVQAPTTEHGTTLGWSTSFNASAVLASRQQYQIQVIGATFSSVTILSAICAVYWFYMMRRNFRRDLILLLIIGDVWKSLWFMVFSSVTLARGHIATLSPFCQASGYLLQTGIESCDVAIFLISLHMSLQIFPPKNSIIGHDGLYQVRHWVWAVWFLLPNLSASLAFINSQAGYISQGGLCTLPIRPFWYRLGLSWIPRYLIWLFVMGVAIRIYLHVGYEFKVFAQEKDQTSSVAIPAEASMANTTITSAPAFGMARTASSQSDSATVEKQLFGNDASAPDDDDDIKILSLEPRIPETARSPPSRSGRRQSVPNWTTPFNNSVTFDISESRANESFSHSTPSSRRGSRQLAPGRASDSIHLPGPLDFLHSRPSTGPTRPIAAQLPHDIASPALSPITEYKTYESVEAAAAKTTTKPSNAAARALQERRRAIQRQLRVLFIYPVVYLIFWVIPFVAHCFSYDNHYAQHPIFALSALNVFCQTFMGFADVCIFSWRERPWRHIPGSDGTFLGSFKFWRFASDGAFEGQEYRRDNEIISNATATASDPTTQHSIMHSGSRTNSNTSFFNSLRRWNPRMSSVGQASPSQRGSDASALTGASLAPSTPRRAPPAAAAHRRAYSGGDNRRIRDAELAHERLALERADWAMHRQSLHDRRASAISTLQSEKKEPERREWWDRQMSLDDDSRDDD